MEVEKEIWECVDTRMREERASLLSDFQAKLSLVQVCFFKCVLFSISLF